MLFIKVSQKRQGDIYYDERVHQKLHLKRVFKKCSKADGQKAVFSVNAAQKIATESIKCSFRKITEHLSI